MRNIFTTILLIALTLGATAQQYDLKLNLKKGQHYTQAMVMDLQMTESISGQDINVTTKMQFEFKQEVKSKTSNGDFVLENEYSRVVMNLDAMGQKMSYDSQVKDTSESGIMKSLATSFSKIMGKKFQVTLSAKGKVIAVTGLKEILAALKSGTEDPAAQKMIEGTLDEKKITSNFESSYHIFPDKPVKVGDSWSQQSSMESMFPMDIKTGYTLQAVKDGIAKISANGDFTMKKDDYEANGMKMKVDFTGTYSGTYDMDIKTGINKKGTILMPMKGTMEIMGMEVPVTVNTNLETSTEAAN